MARMERMARARMAIFMVEVEVEYWGRRVEERRLDWMLSGDVLRIMSTKKKCF